MPRVNVWIRKEDEDKWNDITNKSEWVHNALNTGAFGFTEIYHNGHEFKPDRNAKTEVVYVPDDSIDKYFLVPSKCSECGKFACECVV